MGEILCTSGFLLYIYCRCTEEEFEEGPHNKCTNLAHHTRVGDNTGRLSSYYSNELNSYTAVRAHEEAIQSILVVNGRVVTIGTLKTCMIAITQIAWQWFSCTCLPFFLANRPVVNFILSKYDDALGGSEVRVGTKQGTRRDVCPCSLRIL